MTSIESIGYCSRDSYGSLPEEYTKDVTNWQKNPQRISEQVIRFYSMLGVRPNVLSKIASANDVDDFIQIFSPGDLLAANSLDASNINLRKQPPAGFRQCFDEIAQRKVTGPVSNQVIMSIRQSCKLPESTQIRTPSPETRGIAQ